MSAICALLFRDLFREALYNSRLQNLLPVRRLLAAPPRNDLTQRLHDGHGPWHWLGRDCAERMERRHAVALLRAHHASSTASAPRKAWRRHRRFLRSALTAAISSASPLARTGLALWT